MKTNENRFDKSISFGVLLNTTTTKTPFFVLTLLVCMRHAFEFLYCKGKKLDLHQ